MKDSKDIVFPRNNGALGEGKYVVRVVLAALDRTDELVVYPDRRREVLLRISLGAVVSSRALTFATIDGEVRTGL